MVVEKNKYSRAGDCRATAKWRLKSATTVGREGRPGGERGV